MTPSCPWAVQREAADRLGISERTLHRWRSAGLLTAGEHYRRKFPNPNSPLLYHLERCEQTMSEATARHPGRLEVAPVALQAEPMARPLEVAPTAGAERSLRRFASAPTTSHRAPQGQPGQDAEPLADAGIDAVVGPLAEDAHRIVRPRS